MDATPVAATAAPAPTPAPSAAPAPAARPSTSDLIAAAAKAMEPAAGGEAAPAEPKADAPPLPSTPEAPATAAVLAEQESASQLIRQRNELADARKALDAERVKWKTEQAEHAQRLAAMERAFAEFEADPAAFAKARGTKRPLAEIARDLYLEDAKVDDLPAEQRSALLAQREMLQLKREQERIRAEVQHAQVEQRLTVYRTQLTAGLSEIPAELKHVRHLAAEQPGRLVQLLESMAGDLALKQPGLGLQSAAQLAARLEPALAAEVAPWRKLHESEFKPPTPPPAPAAATPAQPAAPSAPTISPSLSSATPAQRRPMNAQERLAAAVRAFEGRS